MADSISRLALAVTGTVQGVGFRPFVYRLATSCGLCGWVANHAGGVNIEIQGTAEQLADFERRLQIDKPEPATIDKIVGESLALRQESGFLIRESDTATAPGATVLPDLAPCAECLRELFDPGDRRFRYPFINCTHCGPRYSIVSKLPYDRAFTAMRHFPLCENCRGEYTDPANRRFHAEPNACPQCGPQLCLRDRYGNTLAERDRALQQAVDAIAAGEIVALKGVGGFQLLADAANTETIARLRARKQRPHKPFALLYPDLESVRRHCRVSTIEVQLLCSAERPIVLLAAKDSASTSIAAGVAPHNPNLGVMLPASPLHHLLMEMLGKPVVATSGNLSGEPLCIDNAEAQERLANIADLFLVHDRQIVRPLDDSVLRIIDGHPLMLRRARGYAPLPIHLPPVSTADPGKHQDTLALGADQKNSVAVCRADTVYPSQYIGDLASAVAVRTFEQTTADLGDFYQVAAQTLVADKHPGYSSVRWAEHSALPVLGVQHHLAHFFSCMAEHGYQGSALGICWDGTGYGDDGTVWGGEFLHWDGGDSVQRVATMRSFSLPGAERAVREPRRAAFGMLFEIFGREALYVPAMRELFTTRETDVLVRMLEGEINSPRCSSVGRLFDAVAILLGLAGETSFEGQAAMAVEYAAQRSSTRVSYPFQIHKPHEQWEVDWAPLMAALLEADKNGVSAEDRAAAFHNTLARIMLAVALQMGQENIFLSGGVFQNRHLSEVAIGLLREHGFRVHCHSQVPPNDGGIALGQLYYLRCMAACGRPVGEGSLQCV